MFVVRCEEIKSSKKCRISINDTVFPIYFYFIYDTLFVKQWKNNPFSFSTDNDQHSTCKQTNRRIVW